MNSPKSRTIFSWHDGQNQRPLHENGRWNAAEKLGFDKSETYCEIPGVNHFVWMTEFNNKGENIFPALDKWIAEKGAAAWEAGKDVVIDKKRADLYRIFGAVPIGDTGNWTGAAWPWWYHDTPENQKSWCISDPETNWNRYVEGISNTSEKYRKIIDDPSVPVSECFNLRKEGNMSGEPMVPIIESISQGVPRHIIVNMLNTNEFVPGIPRDFQVEISALVSANGIQGIKTNGLPKTLLAHIYRDRIAPVEMEIEAFSSGKRELLTQLVLMDKWCSSLDNANKLIDDLFALPYHKELREHYV